MLAIITRSHRQCHCETDLEATEEMRWRILAKIFRVGYIFESER